MANILEKITGFFKAKLITCDKLAATSVGAETVNAQKTLKIGNKVLYTDTITYKDENDEIKKKNIVTWVQL